MAASYFNQLAAQRGLRWRAVSRGSAADSTTVPKPIVAGLQEDGVDVSDFRPAKIDTADIAGAARIVAIGTELPSSVPIDEQRIERWNDVPPASKSYDAARSSLKAHIAELLDRLSRGPTAGSRIVASKPLGSFFASVSWPSCPSAMARTIARPKPPRSISRALSTPFLGSPS